MTEGGIRESLFILQEVCRITGLLWNVIGILDQLCGKRTMPTRWGVKGTLFWFLGLIAGIWGPEAAGQPRKSRGEDRNGCWNTWKSTTVKR